jgi:hypothetical protein
MAKSTDIKTEAVITRITAAQNAALEDRCAKLGVQRADLLRQLIEQELASQLTDEDEEEDEGSLDLETFFAVFVDTVNWALQPKTSAHQLTQKTFQAIINKHRPGSFETGDSEPERITREGAEKAAQARRAAFAKGATSA